MADGWDEFMERIPPEVAAYMRAEACYHTEEHQRTMQFAPLLCRCRPWYDHDDPGPAQADCHVHTTIMIDARTGEII